MFFVLVRSWTFAAWIYLAVSSAAVSLLPLPCISCLKDTKLILDLSQVQLVTADENLVCSLLVDFFFTVRF